MKRSALTCAEGRRLPVSAISSEGVQNIQPFEHAFLRAMRFGIGKIVNRKCIGLNSEISKINRRIACIRIYSMSHNVSKYGNAFDRMSLLCSCFLHKHLTSAATKYILDL